jgi:uncharacterized protein DUF1203
MTPFEVHAIPEPVLAAARAGHATEYHVAAGGEPLRCCLRDTTAGEEIILFNYRPPLPDSPYRETGAVFAHARPCPGPERAAAYPADWLARPQVLRAYDERGRIHPATRTHDGTDPVGQLSEVLATPGVAWAHSRNIAYGCYMFTATRVGVDPPARDATE